MKPQTPPVVESLRNASFLGAGPKSGKRKRAVSLAALAFTVLLTCNAHALLLSNQTLNVTLLPNTSYEVKLDLSTTAVTALVNTLDALQTDALQIVDVNGNVLGSIPAADLLAAIDEATGGLVGDLTGGVIDDLGDLTDLTQTITLVLNTVDQVVDPIIKTVDTPVVSVSNVTVTPVTSTSGGKKADTAPSVRITKRQSANSELKIKGTASDDQQVTGVTVRTNGKVRKAKGTTNWKSSAKLHKGRNRIVVRSFDNAQHVSAPRRVTIVVK